MSRTDQRRRWLGAFVLCAALAAASAVACRQLVGITDTPPEKLTTTACGLPYGTSDCASCVSKNCCGESTACAADPMNACSVYPDCVSECDAGDSACRAGCAASSAPTSATSELPALSACMAKNCKDECKLTCGAIAALLSTPDAASSCESCLTDNASACGQAQACAQDAHCDAKIRCWLACQTPECRDACAGKTLAEGYLEAEAFLDLGALIGSPNAVDGVCATRCATGSAWACVGQSFPSPPTKDNATIHFSVEDYSGKKPVQDVEVSVCGPMDVGCRSPLARETTNASGIVTLQFQNQRDTSQTWGLDGYLQLTSPALRTTLFYWGFPLVGDGLGYIGYWMNAGQVTTPAEFDAQAHDLGIPAQDQDHGTLAVQAYDCLGYHASGVRISVQPSDALTQSIDLTGVPTNTTDPGGLIIFANAKAGNVEVTATPVGLTRPSSRVPVTVRAGATTIVTMFPTP